MIPASLSDWMLRHHVSLAAMHELHAILGVDGAPFDHVPTPQRGEAYVQSAVRLEAPAAGVTLFRNNVGALPGPNGRPVRYGLANDGAQLNARSKSSDLIGWRRVVITPQHVGSTIAQFVSRECKTADWRYSGTEREIAQLRWITLVAASGGDAAFATGPGTL